MKLTSLKYIIGLLFLLESARADSDSYPTRLLTTQELKIQEALRKESIKEKKKFLKKPIKSSNAKISDLMESNISVNDFLIFDPVAEILKEESKYSRLNRESKDEYLYEKQEKIRNFTEKKLIEKFLDFNFRTKDINELSHNSADYINRHLPLAIVREELSLAAFKSASEGNLLTLRALIGNKVKVDSIDKSGKTLLMYAVNNNQVNVVRFLISQGANINYSDLNNNTALNYAIKNRNSKMYDLLLSFGATTNSPKALTQEAE